MKIAVIGAGISGLSVAHFLERDNDITVFEKEQKPGGLIRCEKVNGSLFHICGGHVFNSKRQDVLNWFWSKFCQEKDFIRSKRKSIVYMDGGKEVPYPIEDHIYFLDEETQKSFIADLIEISKRGELLSNNFEDFLKNRFGNTLYDIYFKPYNEKVWGRDLKQVPLSWLEGKLPMPTVEEMLFNNMNHVEEKLFVHSTFWYGKSNGSQFIADTLSKELNIKYSVPVELMDYNSNSKRWIIGNDEFDFVVYCGNIKDMIHIINGLDVKKYFEFVDALEYHGTTTVFCEIDKNPYSWIYLPSPTHKSHRIICTGNFSELNNAETMPEDRITASVEFTDEVSYDDIKLNLMQMPFNPTYISHKYNKYTYPVQKRDTRRMIKKMKFELAKSGLFFTGRFADWEYYNMDVAVGAAMDLCQNIS